MHYPRISPDPQSNQTHIFAELSPTDPETWEAIDTRAYTWKSAACEGTLWRIQSNAFGVLRRGETTSMTLKEISQRIEAGTGASESPELAGILPLEIFVSPGRGGVPYSFRADANQSIEVYASCVSVDLLAPENFAVVSPQQASVLPGITSTSLVVDELVSVGIAQIDEPLSRNEVHYTTYHGIPSGETLQIQIPRRAVSATIATTGTVGTWVSAVGDPSLLASYDIRSIVFNNGVATFEIGAESYLETDTIAADRLFRIRWDIRP